MRVFRRQEIKTENIQVGDQIIIPLDAFGKFTVTAQKVTDRGIMFMFDDYVARRPMNSSNTNKGGFEESELKKWMDTVLFMAFPDELRDKIYGLTLPSVGQIVGSESTIALEPDTDEQLPLMKGCKNRVASFEDHLAWGWLKNAVKEAYSLTDFALVDIYGGVEYCDAAYLFGVRPVFWVVK